MNGRERLQSILHKRGADRLCWASLVEQQSLDVFPPPWNQMTDLEFFRKIGCDALLLNSGWVKRTSVGFQSPRLVWPEGTKVQETSEMENGMSVQRMEIRTPKRTFSRITRGGHPAKSIVETREDLIAYRDLWEGVTWQELDESAKVRQVNHMLGNDGVAVRFCMISAIPYLLEIDIGIEQFYYLYQDHPEEMQGLIETIHARHMEAFRILARDPFDIQVLVENTSTRYISPALYRRFNGPHQRDFVEIMHAAGKVAILHMCGHVRDLLPDIRQTGADGIHALTPPPTGDTPWEHALDILGEDTIIIGAFPPSVFISGPVEDIGPALDAFYTPRLRRANFVLCPFSDGITVPFARFEAVARWMEKNQ